jgi:hypothetical protein
MHAYAVWLAALLLSRPIHIVPPPRLPSIIMAIPVALLMLNDLVAKIQRVQTLTRVDNEAIIYPCCVKQKIKVTCCMPRESVVPSCKLLYHTAHDVSEIVRH